MPITQLARAVSLSWTPVAGQSPAPPAGPLGNIQSYSFSQQVELAEFLSGTSRVNAHYAAARGATLQIETADIATWAGFSVGQKYTNVALTLEAARDSAGAAVGDNVTITLSEAVVSEVGELGMGNENSAPVVASVTFALSRHAASAADPTAVIASAGGGS